MKAVKSKLKEKGASDDEVTAFEKGASAFAKKIVANFKDYEFLIGESMDPDGMYVLLAPPDMLETDVCQGCPSQLPRGWCHSLRHCVEARVGRDEGLSG